MALEIDANAKKPAKPKAGAKAATAKPATTVQVVLAKAGRYMRATKLYTANVIYNCTTEQAVEMLSWVDELDNQIFKRYKKVVTRAEVEERDATPHEEEVGEIAEAVSEVESRVELASDEEMAELFGEEAEDEAEGVEV